MKALALLSFCLGCASCTHTRGPEIPRPDQVMDFATLYNQNCAGCHGEGGQNGAAVSLANPVYLAVAGKAAVREVVAKGVARTSMPPFAASAGGTLSDPQIEALVDGMFRSWSRPNAIAIAAPAYSPLSKGDSEKGQKAFVEYCARCHGAAGEGIKGHGSIVDSSYLALVSDQSLRSTVVAGRPEQGMPDWRSDMPRAMTDQEITDVVAWLAAQRKAP